MDIRYATLADLDAVAAVEAECFPAAEAATKAEFAERIQAYGSHFWLMLDGEKLSYRIDPQSGQILVPEDELSKTRMTLAAKGVQAILPSGYELMDKDEELGSSQFVQNVRYKRSLEGELAQSIIFKV